METTRIRDRVLLAVTALSSFPVSGAFAADDGTEFLNSAKVLPTNLPL